MELSASGARERVVLRAAILFGDAPLGLDPALMLETMQGRIQRTLVNLQHIARHLANAPRDGPAVLGLQLQRLQNQQVERALDEVDRLDG